MAKYNKRLKKPKQRNLIVLGLIERKGAGAGYHSKRGYTRKEKHKKNHNEQYSGPSGR